MKIKKKVSTLKLLLKRTYPYKFLSISILIASVFFSSLVSYRLRSIEKAMDGPIANKNLDNLINSCLFIGILFLLESVLQFFLKYLSEILAQRVIYNLRKELLAKVIYFKSSFFSKNPPGIMISRFISDIETTSIVFNDGILFIFGDLLKIVISVFTMYKINGTLASISLISLPIMYVVIRRFTKALKKGFSMERLYTSELINFLQERIVGMATIRFFQREDKEHKIFKAINKKLMNAHFKTIFYFSLFFPIVEIISALILAAIIIYGVFNAITIGEIKVGQITAFIFFIYALFQPLRHMADRFNTLQRGVAGAEKIFDLLALDESYSEKSKKAIFYPKEIKGNIVFEKVDFAYDKKNPTLKNISFEIKSGQKIALVGPTGSGKSTLVKLITHLYKPAQGNIYIDGFPIEQISLASLRSHIRLLDQETFLFNGSILENLSFGNSFLNLEKIKRVAKELSIDNFINSLPGNYNYQIREKGANLSMGERQLISLLRMQLSSYSVVILDEATASVDKNVEPLIYKAMDKLIKSKTAIVIAHRLATVKNADKILVLHKGEILEEGTHDQLLKKNNLYSNLYKS